MGATHELIQALGGDELVVRHRDFNFVAYSSFFIGGLRQLAAESPNIHYVADRRSGRTGGPLSLGHVLQFTVEHGSARRHLVIDPTDRNVYSADTQQGFDLEALERCDLYGKTNFNPAGVLADPHTAPHLDKVMPAGPVYPMRHGSVFGHRPRLLPLAAAPWTFPDAVRRIRQSHRLPTTRGLRHNRAANRTHDLHFVLTYYGEGPLAELDGFRVELVERLRDTAASGVIALAGELPPHLSHLSVPLLPPKQYLRAVSGARIAVYVRGVHDCLSFKFGSLLSNGVPIVGQPLHNDLGVDMPAEFLDQFSHESPAELTAGVEALLDDPERQARLGAANLAAFDGALAPDACVARLLTRLVRSGAAT